MGRGQPGGGAAPRQQPCRPVLDRPPHPRPPPPPHPPQSGSSPSPAPSGAALPATLQRMPEPGSIFCSLHGAPAPVLAKETHQHFPLCES